MINTIEIIIDATIIMTHLYSPLSSPLYPHLMFSSKYSLCSLPPQLHTSTSYLPYLGTTDVTVGTTRGFDALYY